MTEKRRNEIDTYNRSILTEKLKSYDYTKKMTFQRLAEHTDLTIRTLARLITIDEIYELNKINYYPTQFERIFRHKKDEKTN